jgi:pSer/pThr/pTyr-binding forkhead associated (FHA) protein
MEGQEDELDERTVQVPGRARLLVGQSERKKVILLNHLPATLGRADPNRKLSPDIDLSPYDPKRSISRKHARIIREGDLFYIEDLKSRNKTWLGELELTPYERQLLRRHDTIQIGLLELIFEY